MKKRPRDDLSELRARLQGGVGPAARRGRLGAWGKDDTRAFEGWDPGADFAIVENVHDHLWEQESEVSRVIDLLTARFRGDRRLLLAVLFAPARALARIEDKTPGGHVGAWMGLCWTAEAAWRFISDDGPAPGYAKGDRELLFPLAARLRFLTLIEPMRWRAELDRAWWYDDADQDFEGTELVRRVLGDEPWHILVGQCREARRSWLGCLAEYQSHLYLVQASGAELEKEFAAVMFRHRCGAPLSLPGNPLTNAVSPTAEDKAVIADVTNQHLLPRFELLRVISAALYEDTGRVSVPRLLTGVAAVLCALAAVGFAAFLHAQVAAELSAVCYAVICGGAVAFGPGWAAQWLLRLPAAAAVGVIALISVMAGGWLGAPHAGIPAAVVFIAAACGYLAVQLRNHDVEGWPLTRSLAVAAIGAVHALMVSLLGLVYVGPAFVPKPKLLAAVWVKPGYGYAGLVLLLATAWCLAVGVFSQILWDDRPVTAPLAHQSWRK